MQHLHYRKRWAASWLRGQAKAVARGALPPKTLPSTLARALDCGLSADEIVRILQELDESGPASYREVVDRA